MLRASSALVVVLALSGCATVVSGISQGVAVKTDPPGATCTLESEGESVGVVMSTPGAARVSRSRKDIVVNCKKDGFQATTATDPSHIIGATVGNLLVGGLVGVVVDASTGANFEYTGDVRLALMSSAADGTVEHGHTLCPDAHVQAGRTDSTIVVYMGPDAANPDACLVSLGDGKTRSYYFLVESTEDTNASSIDAALKSIVYKSPGPTVSYTSGSGQDQWNVQAFMAAPEVLLLNDRVVQARRLVLRKRQPSSSIEGDETIWLDPIDGMPLKREWVQTGGPKLDTKDWTVTTLRTLDH